MCIRDRYWIIDSPVTITDVMLPNETRTLPVTITTPELEMPLNPSWKVSSIERVDLMVQAIPLLGGVPAVNQTTLLIDSIVELDISVTSEIDDITVNDIIGGNTDRFVGFEVTIVHNLGSSNTLAQVSLSAMPCTSLAPTTAASGSPWKQSTCSNGKVFFRTPQLAQASLRIRVGRPRSRPRPLPPPRPWNSCLERPDTAWWD